YDNSELVKAIFTVLWQDTFNLDIDSIGDGKAFRGDTIHTSGALFGHKNETTQKYEGLHDRLGIQDELQTLIKAWPISRIGNMLLLPSKSIEITNSNGKKSHVTINTFRGFQSGWHDYFDIFLENIRNVFDKGIPTQTIENEATLPNIMSLEENRSNYFNRFLSFEDWKQCMMLDDYLENGTIKKYFDLDFKQYPYHWKYRKITDDRRDAYCGWVKDYITRTSELITLRSNHMVKELQKKGF
ncbi:MAG: hypothetical protein IJS08_07525, partial [Victivallales bacterium]|nr:hypothetical protein [Victivallales bacterium]